MHQLSPRRIQFEMGSLIRERRFNPGCRSRMTDKKQAKYAYRKYSRLERTLSGGHGGRRRRHMIAVYEDNLCHVKLAYFF